MTDFYIAWTILAAFFSFVGVPGFLSFLGINDSYWRLWLAGHIFIVALCGLIAAIFAVYWALSVVLSGTA